MDLHINDYNHIHMLVIYIKEIDRTYTINQFECYRIDTAIRFVTKQL
jgi:hypothetical protein